MPATPPGQTRRQVFADDTVADRLFQDLGAVDSAAVVRNRQPDPITLGRSLDRDLGNLVFAGVHALIRAFGSVIDGVSDEMQKRFPQCVDDAAIELCIAGFHRHLDLFAKGGRELACVVRQASEERLQRLHLKVENGIELAVGEPAQDPLPSFEVNTDLTQRGRESGQNLPGGPFTDPSLGEGGKSEDPVREALGCHRHKPEASTPLGEIVDHIGGHTHLLTGPPPTFRRLSRGIFAPVGPRFGFRRTTGRKRVQVVANFGQSKIEINA